MIRPKCLPPSWVLATVSDTSRSTALAVLHGSTDRCRLLQCGSPGLAMRLSSLPIGSRCLEVGNQAVPQVLGAGGLRAAHAPGGKITEEVVANIRSGKHSGFCGAQSVRLEDRVQEEIHLEWSLQLGHTPPAMSKSQFLSARARGNFQLPTQGLR